MRCFFWTLNRVELENKPQGETREQIESPENKATQVVEKATVPLATGKEPIDKIFVQSGCAACHTIPGIRVAKGREGPKLELGTTAVRALGRSQLSRDGQNRLGIRAGIHSLIRVPISVEGYPDRVMPRWYGQKLTAGALDKIIAYLLKIEEVS